MDRELRTIRWVTFAALLVVAAAYLAPLAAQSRPEFPLMLLLVLVAAALLTWAIESWLQLLLRRSATQPASALPATISQDTQLILSLNHRLLGAHTPQEVVESVMQAGRELTGAPGSSFVPFDEWGQSILPLTQGRIPASALASWSERLSRPETRQVCKACREHIGDHSCTLLVNTDQDHIFCLNLVYDGHPAGVFNFYFPAAYKPDARTQQLFDEIIRSADLTLQSVRWRDQEVTALRYLQTQTDQREDLSGLLESLLENVRTALEVDFALLSLTNDSQGVLRTPLLVTRAKRGGKPVASLPDSQFLAGIWQSVAAARSSISMENVSLGSTGVWKHLLAVPLVWREDAPVGLLLVGTQTVQNFSQRQLLLLQTVAGEAALLIQNARLMAKVQFQAVMDERTRLAREIHDGLAQTLAFLKMQTSQMQSYLEQGNLERLTTALNASSQTLSDAYQDARQAIDNLRRTPELGLESWLFLVAEDFRTASGLEVDTTGIRLDIDFESHIQAQLIRIFQESLNNIRKHAHAGHVWLACWKSDGAAVFEIRDDGDGFSPDSIVLPSQHGLRGMRERAELIGADFQVISRPGDGTTVRFSVPLGEKERS